MQRGVLTLDKNELTQLLQILNLERFVGTQLYEKLKSASQSSNEQIQILLSEDETERILDEVGPPISDNQILNSALKKISNLMLSFRS